MFGTITSFAFGALALTSVSAVAFVRSPDVAMQPVRYAIRLWPQLTSGTFRGWLDVELKLRRPTDRLLLDSLGLEVENANISRLSPYESVAVANVESLPDREKIEVRTEREMPPGTYELHLEYTGSMANKIVGLYSSSYKDSDGRNRLMASSKFEPTYARQAFPCFDEPAMKANYSVELVTPNDYIALSNMDQLPEESKFDENNKIVHFRESVKMSTYLVCFIVCDFDYKNETINTEGIGDNFKFSVYGVKDQLDKVDFSLKFGKSITEYFIKYFGIPYPLPKLDMIAIPDFVSGAMEHWGLVTFRETNLLYDSHTTSTANMQNIARVVAHEISHMWFGNLVTMKWWNDLWLNEGFASYMQYKAVDAVHPEWKMLEQFITSNSHSIFSLDGTLNSHPIVQTVETPDEITAIFDSITYNKGAAIIRMLEGFVGPDIFQKGVTNYLTKYSFGNTETKDLLDELEKIFESEHKITRIMDTWTRQVGLPVVKVERLSSTVYRLTQKKFLLNTKNTPKPSEYNDKWYIPITYKINENSNRNIVWFPDTHNEVNITLGVGESLLKINDDQEGYYRVNYDNAVWQELEEKLKKYTQTKLTNSDRAHLLNDIFTLAEASEVSYSSALNISTYLNIEKEYIPWLTGANIFSELKMYMIESDAYMEYRNFVQSLLKDIKSELENPSEHSKILLRSTIYDLACSMGDQELLNKMNQLFKEYLNGSAEANPDLKSIIYYYGVQATGEKEWLELWDKFIKENDAQEKNKLMSALSASSDPSILRKYLNLAWKEEFIRSQDHLIVLQQVSRNPIGTPLVWDHVRENWPRLVDKFTLNSRTLGTMIPAITRSFATKLKLKEMEMFFDEYPEAGAGATARKQALEKVMNNIEWVEKHEPIIKSWLEANQSKKRQ